MPVEMAGRRFKMTKAYETATASDKALSGADLLDAFKDVPIKAEDRRFKNKLGECNIVARVRATRKGQHAYSGPCEGTDGNRYHVIRLGADGVLYCDCPSWRFSKGPAKTCKHVRALLSTVHECVTSGENRTVDVIIYNARAILAAA